MTAEQKLAAADVLLSSNWYADSPRTEGGGAGYTDPPDFLVAEFNSALDGACRATGHAKSLSSEADDVIVSSGHWRLDPGS
jgi:hypothetical protein